MSENSLPDEIISEILSPALKVPDEKFADTYEISPFTEYSESPSAYLLVCKSWLRVATPLLYNVVVLRSKAQAKALGQALSKNKDLGQFIKRLRVEGGYGAPMRTILKAAPNITDLCLSFSDIFASDNTVGLCDGLASIQPRRLILCDSATRPLHNKMIEKLVDAIAAAIPQWQQLTILHCPYMDYIVDRPGIVEALVDARRLQEVAVKLIEDAVEAYSLLQDCPLRSIQVTNPVYPDELEELNWEEQPTSLKEITKYETYRGIAASSHVIPTPQFSFTPMASEPREVQDKIWSRVLYFLLSIPLSPGFLEDHCVSPSRLPFLLVSRTFYRLGLPHYYAHVLLMFSDYVSKFTNILERNPSLGQHVRTIVAGTDLSKPYDTDSHLNDESDPMLPITSKLTGLTKLWGSVNGSHNWAGDFYALQCAEVPFTWDAFLAAVGSSGRTLQEISIPIGYHSGAHNPAVFAQLDQLRSLTWICSTEFALDADNVPVGGLSKLTDLRILRAGASFLDLFARMELPALRKVTSAQFNPGFWSFLRSHGSKLVEFDLANFSAEDLETPILEACPNIRILYIYSRFDQGGMLKVEHLLKDSTAANSLEKIVFKIEDCEKDQDAGWTGFLGAIESTQFPQMSEIQFKACQWPKKERDIPKSKWVRWSELLLEQGINLTDSAGKKWRTRLK